jgi:hypothetical protein
MKKLFLILLVLSIRVNADLGGRGSLEVDGPTIIQYPSLKKFLFKPPESNFRFGVGMAPLGLMGSKFLFSLSLFQLHYMTDRWDFEVISASIGKAFSNNEFANTTSFSLKSSPRVKLFSFFETGVFSIGPLLGMEVVRFDDVEVTIKKNIGGNNFITTTNPVNLSTFGFIYGVSLSQTFKLKSGNQFKVNEVFYSQNYDISKTRFDWEYNFQDQTVTDPENIQELEKSSVFMIEFSYIY